MNTIDTRKERQILFEELDRIDHQTNKGLEVAARFMPPDLAVLAGPLEGPFLRWAVDKTSQAARSGEAYKVLGDAVSGRLQALDRYCRSIEERLAAGALRSLTQGSAAQDELYSYLDALTPYYLPKVDVLSKQKQQVLVTFADPRPARLYQNIAEVTQATRCLAPSVALVLSQLSQLGLLERQRSDSRSPRYTVKDPAFHAFLIMRYGNRGSLRAAMFAMLAKKVINSPRDAEDKARHNREEKV